MTEDIGGEDLYLNKKMKSERAIGYCRAICYRFGQGEKEVLVHDLVGQRREHHICVAYTAFVEGAASNGWLCY